MQRKYLLNVVKAAAVMFTVGIVLAYAATPIASIAGVSAGMLGTATHPLWTGLYFGAFGGISAAVTPAINYVADAIAGRFFKSKAPAEISTDLKISTGPVVMSEAKHHGIDTHFQDMLAAKKAAASSLLHNGM